MEYYFLIARLDHKGIFQCFDRNTTDFYHSFARPSLSWCRPFSQTVGFSLQLLMQKIMQYATLLREKRKFVNLL